MNAVLTRPVTLSPPLRASVLWLDEADGAWVAQLPEAERTRLLESFVAGMTTPPFGRVSIIPTTLTSTTTRDLDLPALRSTAARFQSDVLVLLTTRAHSYADPNLLATSYIALIPMLFVPGNDLAIYASAEACALDVRAGVFLACSQGRGEAKRSFVTLGGREQRGRELTASAASTALAGLPSDLARAVWLRLADASSGSGGAYHALQRSSSFPDGVEYHTRER